MTGLIISDPYIGVGGESNIEVMWGNDRGQLYPAGCICQEYVDELESVK